MNDETKIVIPSSTKWDVGLTLITMIVVVGAIGTLFFTQLPFDIENASPLMKAVMIGSVIGTVIGVAVVCFNITIFLCAALGSVLWVGVLALKEKLFGDG